MHIMQLLRGKVAVSLIPMLVIMLAVSSSCTRQASYPTAAQRGGNVIIDTVTLEPSVPQFYSYRYQGRTINYFVLKLDGKVSSFLDACASCYTHKQGYRYEAGAVICRYCNMKFPVYKLESGLGSCYPIKIEGKMAGGEYLIPVEIFEKESVKF